MKLLPFLLACGFSAAILADDTEIYGASEIDAENRVNSNVMFVMDTSGSMGTKVEVTKVPYVNSTNYPGNYRDSEFYIDLNQQYNRGSRITSALQSQYSSECADVVTKLNAEGRVLVNMSQWRSGNWRNLQQDNHSYVRCDYGTAYWAYSGNYMNWRSDSTNVAESTRLKVVVDVVQQLTESLTNINLGLMRFDSNSDGGMVDVPISNITTSGPLIRTIVGNYNDGGGTPLEETFYEAVRYYQGKDWVYGNNSSPNKSISTSRNGNTYTSPITATCQKNHIILLTDGDPSNDTDANSRIKTLVNNMILPDGLSDECSGSGQCMDELAYYIQNTDQAPDTLIGEQPITTYTIGGFGDISGVDLLKRTAKWGGGKYFEANDTQGLTVALESIFLDILSTDSTFTAPAVSVNAFNASEHRDELFYALFRPDDNAKWGGNLKKYRLTDEGFVYDANNTPAVSDATGFFNDSSKDFWNNTPDSDGNNVMLGGIANLLIPANRKLYSDSNNSLQLFSTVASPTTLDMESESTENVTKLKSWVQGIDVNDENGDNSSTDSRNSIGDPLHTEPLVITYGGTDDNPDSTIYFATNEGFIHAISTKTGAEQFAFLPTELHRTQKIFYENTTAAGDRPYGVDGPISNWFYDKNQNNVLHKSGTTTVEDNEHVYIYAGMRRGGNSYYGLNVTDRNNPELLFKIEGGVTSGFEKLGQTWSRMTIAKVMFNGAQRFVLFFAGGYDTNQDGNDLPEADSVGNAVYMVDAKTGELLWTASNENADLNIPNMINSIPASLSAVDITGEGNIDYLFAADTGGRVFRFDIKQGNAGKTDFAQGGVIASLAGTDAENNRRFYNKPNVSLVKNSQYGDHLTIAIGSGHRAHPIYNKTVKDRFYMIKDFNPYRAPSTYTITTAAPVDETTLSTGDDADKTKLYNATSLMTQGKTALTSSMQRLMNNGGGWYVTFSNTGEKVLSESTTFAGAVIFTTFSPSSDTATGCGPDTGQSRAYALGQTSAMSVIDLDGDGDVDANDSSVTLSQSGIAPRPVVIYRPGGGKTIAIGTETLEDDRFNETPPDPDCAALGTCPLKDQKCTVGNCYVVPQYWRQNDITQ
ncbi:pilus assembly protein [Pseudomonas sp. HK3]